MTAILGKTAIWGEAPPLRVIPIEPGEGAWNMAVDEALLETANETGEPILRFYTWSRPVLSLGFFQAISQRQAHPSSLPCELVRRASGGGAIVHDQELTYSLSAPRKLGNKELAADYYRMVHEAIVDVLLRQDIAAELVAKTEPHCGRIDPFLCFERRSPNDIVVNGHKVCGSAQRRSERAVLQHGSLLIRSSPYAPVLPGIEQLSSKRFNLEVLTSELSQAIAKQFSTPLKVGSISPAELLRVSSILEAKYGSYSWSAKIRKNE